MPTTRKTTRLRLKAVAAAAVLLLSACAETPLAPPPEVHGRALILGPDRGFDPNRPADPWWRAPRGDDARFATVDLDGVLVLRVDAPQPSRPSTTVLGRRLAAPLLATPFLQWAWYLEPAIYGGGAGDGLERGLRVTVGFYGGAPSSPQITDRLFGGPTLADRQLDITFGGLGTLRGEDSEQQMVAVSGDGIRSVLRASQVEQNGEWKIEALDLARLYQTFWPRDRIDRTRISYIAVGGLPGRPAIQGVPLGYIAEVSLSR